MKWNIEYVKEAQRDLKRLESYNRKIILKAIEKTAERLLPPVLRNLMYNQIGDRKWIAYSQPGTDIC